LKGVFAFLLSLFQPLPMTTLEAVEGISALPFGFCPSPEDR
jgi:hypothetical protein